VVLATTEVPVTVASSETKVKVDAAKAGPANVTTPTPRRVITARNSAARRRRCVRE
jgi:hypothetical protein